MEKKSNEFHQGALTIVIFLVIFTGRAKNLKKLDQLQFAKFQFTTIPAIRRDKRH